MNDLVNQIEYNIRSRMLLQRGRPLLVAVSGGVDSMVLLHVLHQLARRNDWRLSVAHLNHLLRGRSSDADERLVCRTAEKLQLPIIIERADVRAFARAHKLSVEMAARKLRHDFLARAAAQRQIPSITLAHHADDQLELFFLRLLRGSGGAGLAGMKWRSPSPSNPKIDLVRPLLDQSKSALHAYASERKIRFREDASNAWLDIKRNRIRHELLPLLRKHYQPALNRTIFRVMEIVGAESEFVTEAALNWLEAAAETSDKERPSKIENRAPKRVLFRRVSFEELPVAVQRRCLQLQILRHGVPADFELVEKLRQSRAGVPPALGSTTLLRDSSGILHLQESQHADFNAGSVELHLRDRAGEITFDGIKAQWRIESKKGLSTPKNAPREEFFDADKVGSPILLRHWQPGDRFQPIGLSQLVKVQDFFTNQKVPRNQRRKLVLAATAQGEIFWVEDLRISERFKLTKSTNRRLQWRWQRL